MSRIRFLQLAVCGSLVFAGAAGCAHAVETGRDPNPHATVQVDVRDAAGAPLADVAVRLIADANPGVPVAVGYTMGDIGVKFGGLGAGEYEVVVAAPAGFQLQTDKAALHVSARMSETSSVTVVLTKQ